MNEVGTCTSTGNFSFLKDQKLFYIASYLFRPKAISGD